MFGPTGDGRVLAVVLDAVAIEDIIRAVITWFGVTPRKQDWEAVLDRTQGLFAELAQAPA